MIFDRNNPPPPSPPSKVKPRQRIKWQTARQVNFYAFLHHTVEQKANKVSFGEGRSNVEYLLAGHLLCQDLSRGSRTFFFVDDGLQDSLLIDSPLASTSSHADEWILFDEWQSINGLSVAIFGVWLCQYWSFESRLIEQISCCSHAAKAAWTQLWLDFCERASLKTRRVASK